LIAGEILDLKRVVIIEMRLTLQAGDRVDDMNPAAGDLVQIGVDSSPFLL
jgi:hypothetical protein